ncbi:HPP family protein [Methylobacillus flagellatus]|uniref:HPP family protein n=1 Tax=Methylobacillus flagellatus TaxID=405 RepID=UPI0010F83082|nr:HPP family protein [Methylobacillus flagellatus]
MSSLRHWLYGFIPQPLNINFKEQLRASIGALLGLLLTSLLTLLLAGPGATLWLIAPMGASAVLLFAVPSSPLAQPWSILGGNILAAVIGVTCAQWISDISWAAAIAVAISIAGMFALRCLHPPSGAVALSAVLGGQAMQSYDFVLFPVAVNSLLLLLTALLYNNLTRRPYPHPARQKPDQHGLGTRNAMQRFGFSVQDLNHVLKAHNEFIDISPDDLENLFLETEMQVYRRKLGEITCADIMSAEVITAEFGTSLEEAWGLLRRHDIKALPVIDRARRVIGIVTQIDFMKDADLELYQGFEEKLKRFIRRTVGHHADKPEVVGQIMTTQVISAHAQMHIVGLIPLIAQQGLHHIPVIDAERRLVGILTQSDLIAALYRHVSPAD